MKPTLLQALAGHAAGVTVNAGKAISARHEEIPLPANVLLLGDPQVMPDGALVFVSVDIDTMLAALFGSNVPSGPATHAKLLAGDPDGSKGFAQHFDRWKAKGLIQ